MFISRIGSVMKSSSPLIALKTISEVIASDIVVRVYVLKVAVELANETLKVLKGTIGLSAIDLQHLRRFARLDDLPYHLRSTFCGYGNVATSSEPMPTSADLYLLVGPVTSINLSELRDVLRKILPEQEAELHTAAVPLLAPTSLEQAKSWSSSHWPTVHKKSNPFGPHPSIVSHAEQEIIKDLDTWMGMAARAAIGSKSRRYGEAIGAVIVQRACETSRAVALAGDGRWKGYERDGVGNPMAHAVLRVIGMVAKKLKTLEEKKDYCPDDRRVCEEQEEQDVFLDGPMMPEEQEIYESADVHSNQYLCNGLEIFITHEPCVACCMALLHSRFARVVFGYRMPQTGGLCSDMCTVDKEGRENCGLGYGLFWRKELNWNLLAWQTKLEDTGLHIDSILHA